MTVRKRLIDVCRVKTFEFRECSVLKLVIGIIFVSVRASLLYYTLFRANLFWTRKLFFFRLVKSGMSTMTKFGKNLECFCETIWRRVTYWFANVEDRLSASYQFCQWVALFWKLSCFSVAILDTYIHALKVFSRFLKSRIQSEVLSIKKIN